MLSRNNHFFGKKFKVFKFGVNKEYINPRAERLYAQNERDLRKHNFITKFTEELVEGDIIVLIGDMRKLYMKKFMMIAEQNPTITLLYYTLTDVWTELQLPANFIIRYLGNGNPYNEEIKIEENCPKFDDKLFPCSICRMCLKFRPNLPNSFKSWLV
jgi:hypothetical protein